MCIVPDARSGPITILVVEDEPAVREIVVRFLSLGGFTTLEAATLEEALRVGLRHSGRVDGVLLDVGVLFFDGMRWVDQLRAAHPEARLLYCSGYPRADLEASGVLPPDATFLAKPMILKTLCATVREFLAPPSA